MNVHASANKSHRGTAKGPRSANSVNVIDVHILEHGRGTTMRLAVYYGVNDRVKPNRVSWHNDGLGHGNADRMSYVGRTGAERLTETVRCRQRNSFRRRNS